MKKTLLFLLLLLTLLCACSLRPEAVPEPTPEPTAEPTPEPTPEPVVICGLTLSPDAEALDLSLARQEEPSEAELPAEAEPAAESTGETSGAETDSAGEESAGEAEPAYEIIRPEPGQAVVPCSAEELRSSLERLPNLRFADLSGWPLTNEEELALHGAFPNVEFGWDVDVLGVKANSLDSYLCLDNIAMADSSALEELLPLLFRIERFDMCGCGIEDEPMYEFTQRHPDKRFVWIAHIGRREVRTDVTYFCSNSEGDKKVKPTSALMEKQLKYFPDLIALDLGHSHENIQDISWVRWVPNLEILILVGCDLTDLSPLTELKNLTYLELFTNRNLADISPLGELESLRDLNLSLTNVSDLTPLYGLKNLRRLWVNACVMLPAEEVDAFYYAMPDCGISYMQNATGAQNGWRLDDRYYWMRDVFHAEYMPLELELKYGVKGPTYYKPEGVE